MEDVVESPNLLGHWSCLLRKRLDRILLRSATHPSFFPLAANLEMYQQINPILNNENLVPDGLDDLVPLDGVLGGLGSLQLLDDRAAGTDPDTLFPQEAVLAHRIWGVDEVLYSESTCMAFEWNHL